MYSRGAKYELFVNVSQQKSDVVSRTGLETRLLCCPQPPRSACLVRFASPRKAAIRARARVELVQV